MQTGQVLIPVNETAFWQQMRMIMEEVLDQRVIRANAQSPNDSTKLLKVKEICQLFQVSKPTVYDWIRKGQLKSVKINSRRFFVAGDVEDLIVKSRTAAL